MLGSSVEILTFFVYAFTSVFLIVNPVGALVTFVSLTGEMSEAERHSTARRSVFIAFILALIFSLAGEFILRLFHITVDNLRVAGGILLLIVALDMLHARTPRESVTPEELKDAARREDISVFPLATPLLTGPGAITTVIVMMRTGRTLMLKLATFLAILLTFLAAFVIFRYSGRVFRLLGVTALMVINRIMGLMLGAIAVNFISVGAWNIYKSLAG